MRRNPRKVRWTKAFRKAAGKEMTVDSVFDFEKKRNIPIKYDRTLWRQTCMYSVSNCGFGLRVVQSLFLTMPRSSCCLLGVYSPWSLHSTKPFPRYRGETRSNGHEAGTGDQAEARGSVYSQPA